MSPKFKLTLAIGMIACGFCVPQANALTINFASNAGSLIEFQGASDTFRFLPEPNVGNEFTVSGFGFQGTISGVYTIGAITISGATQSANVTGTGVISINDGLGVAASNFWTATVDWKTIQTQGTGVNINLGGVLNLTAVNYTGTNATLLGLKASTVGTAVVNFTILPAPGKTLTQLTTDASTTSAYSGDIDVPDGGTTVAMLGMALVGLAGLRRKFLRA